MPLTDTDRTAILARVLRDEAARQNLSGVEIARRSGLAQTAVAATLRGHHRPLLPTVLAILGVLGRDLRWLHRQGVTPMPPESD